MFPISSAIEFKPMEFINNLRYMGEGMLGILLVMLIIIGSIFLLNRLYGGKKTKKK